MGSMQIEARRSARAATVGLLIVVLALIAAGFHTTTESGAGATTTDAPVAQAVKAR